jgi:hypothetical protein
LLQASTAPAHGAVTQLQKFTSFMAFRDLELLAEADAAVAKDNLASLFLEQVPLAEEQWPHIPKITYFDPQMQNQ